jgi:hypothetical protein
VTDPLDSAEMKARRIHKIVVLWEILTLSGISIVSLFIIWHLKRRSGIVRNQINLPIMKNRELQLPDESLMDSVKDL